MYSVIRNINPYRYEVDSAIAATASTTTPILKRYRNLGVCTAIGHSIHRCLLVCSQNNEVMAASGSDSEFFVKLII